MSEGGEQHGTDQPNGPGPTQETGLSEPATRVITAEQMDDAMLMIDHALRRGQDIPQEILDPILQAKSALEQGKLTSSLAAGFMRALAKLSRLIDPATVESIKFSGSKDPAQQRKARRIAKRYNWLGIIVFVVLIFLQGYWFVLNSFVQNVKSVKEQLIPYGIVADLSWKEVYEDQQKHSIDAAQSNVKESPPDFFDPGEHLLETRLVQNIMQIELETYATADGKLKLPTTPIAGSADQKSTPIAGSADQKSAQQTSVVSFGQLLFLKNSLDMDASSIRRLVFGGSDSHLTESHGPIYFRLFNLSGNDLEGVEKANYILELLSRFLLPVVYGFLGASVALVRRIYNEYSRDVLSQISAIDFRLRFFLGGVSGLAISWFITPSAGAYSGTAAAAFINLSPLVLSFVAGYAVELLFTIVDRIVSAFTSNEAKTPR